MKKLLHFLLLQLIATVLFAQTAVKTFTYQDSVRKYIRYVPVSYNASQPVPLVIMLHGLGGTANAFNSAINMKPIADTANFIYVVPEALKEPLINQNAWNSGAGAGGLSPNQNIDDVGFINAIIDSVSAYYNIDQTRIYASGHSMGGYMTNRLGCELNNRIAAIASVAGTIGNVVNCQPTRAIPAAHFHGTSDGTVPYTNNQYGMDAEATTAFWINHNHCDTVAIIDTFPNTANDGKTVVHYTYPNGDYGTQVEFFKIINGGHDWMKTPNNDISHTLEIWKFFRKFQWTAQATGISPLSFGEGQEVRTYPNPAQNFFIVELPNQNFSVEIFDVSGRKVYSEKNASGKVEIDCSGFSNGIYFVQTNNREKIITQKLLKE